MVRDWRGLTDHTMFGHPSDKAGETIFALLVTDGVVLTRLPEGERDELDAAYETGNVEANGQTIATWVRVTVGADDLDALRPFVQASHDAALGDARDVPPPTGE